LEKINEDIWEFFNICANDILPGPTIITTSDTANRIKSNSIPLSPVKLWAPLTKKIAPNMIIVIITADNLLIMPKIKKIPGINSANAIGICISIGIPIFVRKLLNPGLNLAIP
jgi:hypothetical protein